MSEPSEKVVCRDIDGVELHVGDTVVRVERSWSVLPLGEIGTITQMQEWRGCSEIKLAAYPREWWHAEYFRLVRRVGEPEPEPPAAPDPRLSELQSAIVRLNKACEDLDFVVEVAANNCRLVDEMGGGYGEAVSNDKIIPLIEQQIAELQSPQARLLTAVDDLMASAACQRTNEDGKLLMLVLAEVLDRLRAAREAVGKKGEN